MHAAILGGFFEPRGGGTVLWRLDQEPHRLELVVVSEKQPDLSHFIEDGGWSPSPADYADYEPFLRGVSPGRRYRFRLVANPTRSTKHAVSAGRRGRVVGVGSREAQEAWLVERSDRLGFRVPADDGDLYSNDGVLIARRNLTLTGRERLRFTKSGSGNRHAVTLDVARFDGLLEVTDPDRLKAALRAGIGRGKAYGCGLLTLAPVT
jgi:CRISPR system Cascade subunit CasE